MRNELTGRFGQHLRLGPVSSDTIVRQPPNAAVPGDFVELILLDLLTQVSPFPRPFRAFDHAAVHVGDVHRSVRAGRDVDWTKQWIERANELGALVDVPQLRESLGFDRSHAPDDPRDL